ncbi:MAG: T9SS type A sorting domain-containing protein, partial [Bacteroidota bacterium]
TNACGTSPVRSLSIIKSGPAAPSAFDVQYTAPCPNRLYTYTEPAMPRAATQLIWTVPVGATIVSGQGTTSIQVSYPPSVSSGNVSVQSINNCMVGATRSLVIKMAACPNSITSIATSGKGELNPDDLTVKIYPNPTTSEFKMSIQSTANENVSIKVMDMQGRLVKKYSISASQAMNFGNDLKPGSYMVEIAQANKKTVQRVMKF